MSFYVMYIEYVTDGTPSRPTASLTSPVFGTNSIPELAIFGPQSLIDVYDFPHTT